jgi:imidazolonepropionase-like amidohydrolase
MFRWLGLIVVVCSFLSTEAAAATVLRCGKLIDVQAQRVLSQMTVVAEGAAIRRIEKGFAPAGAGDQVVNLRDHTCMPGLIDSHVHLTEEYSPLSDI